MHLNYPIDTYRDNSCTTSDRFVKPLDFRHFERFFRFDQSDRKTYKKAISDGVNVSVVLGCGFGNTSCKDKSIWRWVWNYPICQKKNSIICAINDYYERYVQKRADPYLKTREKDFSDIDVERPEIMTPAEFIRKERSRYVENVPCVCFFRCPHTIKQASAKLSYVVVYPTPQVYTSRVFFSFTVRDYKKRFESSAGL